MFGRDKKREKKIIFLSLSYGYISIAYEEDLTLKKDSYKFEIQKDIDILMEIWVKGLKELLDKVYYKPQLILLFNSSSFMVRNIQDIETQEDKYKYLSKQLDLPRGFFEMINIKNNSYLVVGDKAIKKILFAFKDYHINALHDTSVLNGLHFLSKNSELYINLSLSGLDVVLNGELFQKRSSQSLFLNYLEESAKRLNLDLDSLYTHIRKNLNDIKSYEMLKKSTKNGAVELRKFIDELATYIESSLSFFNNYENFKQIDVIRLDGDVLALEFISLILEDRLGIEIVSVAESLKLNDYREVSTTVAYQQFTKNILEKLTLTLDGLNYSDGKQELIFIDDKLISKKNLTKEQQKKVIQFTRVVELSKERESKKNYKRPNKSIWKMDEKELLALIKSKIFTNATQEREDVGTIGERGKVIFLITLISIVGILYLWSYINDLETRFKTKVRDYSSTLNSIELIEKELHKGSTIVVGDGKDKILWTEKLVAISNSIPTAIWFSSLRMENMKESDLSLSKVTIDGRCLPSDKGHIFSIADYMERVMMNSNEKFKRDFKNISFGGAEIIFEGQELINFKLDCYFEKNINIKKEK